MLAPSQNATVDFEGNRHTHLSGGRQLKHQLSMYSPSLRCEPPTLTCSSTSQSRLLGRPHEDSQQMRCAALPSSSKAMDCAGVVLTNNKRVMAETSNSKSVTQFHWVITPLTPKNWNGNSTPPQRRQQSAVPEHFCRVGNQSQIETSIVARSN